MKIVEIVNDGVTLPLLTSEILAAFPHGFTTRDGGVSPAPYASLNLGMGWGDDREAVLENRRRVRVAARGDRLCLVKQVHGRDVFRVTAETTVEALAAAHADALITDVAGTSVAVFTADCVPVLLADPISGAVGAVHAGWRGVIAGVLPATIAAMTSAFGAEPGRLCVAIGPAIGPCCFEVGAEVVTAFEAALPDVRAAGGVQTPGGPAGKSHLDLRLGLRRQLASAGVPEVQVEVETACTRCDPAGRFYSYRRDNTRTGQHLAVITSGRREGPGRSG